MEHKEHEKMIDMMINKMCDMMKIKDMCVNMEMKNGEMQSISAHKPYEVIPASPKLKAKIVKKKKKEGK